MKINVASVQKRDDIRAALEASESPKYTFNHMVTRIEMQFDVDPNGFEGDLLRETKKLIRNTKYGPVLMFRVLIDGQLFEGGKVYQPGDLEYAATHPEL